MVSLLAFGCDRSSDRQTSKEANQEDRSEQPPSMGVRGLDAFITAHPENVQARMALAEYLRRNGRVAVAETYEQNAKTLSSGEENPQ